MSNKKKFKVGDKIVEFGQVYKIFKVKRQKNGEGEFDKYIFYKPYFKAKESNNLVCSLPLKNIEMAEIRKPISKKKLKELLKSLKTKRAKKFKDVTEAKDSLKENNPKKTIRVIKFLHIEKKNSDSFSKSKKDTLKMALDMFVQEFAAVKGVSLDKAGEKVKKTLSN